MGWRANVDGLMVGAAVTRTNGNYPVVGVATPMISAVILVIRDAIPTIGVIPTTGSSSYVTGDIVLTVWSQGLWH